MTIAILVGLPTYLAACVAIYRNEDHKLDRVKAYERDHDIDTGFWPLPY